MIKFITRPSSDAVRRANRAVLLLILSIYLASTFFVLALGMSEAVAFCLGSAILLMALQYLLRGTAQSPLEVLRRYREVNLPTALYITVLLYLTNLGISVFAGVFLPNLYSIATDGLTTDSTWEVALLLFGFVVLAPFYEELVFRGLALSAYRDARSTLFAVLFTSILFGSLHGSIVHALVTFSVGFVLALVMLKTGQLWTVIVAHMLNNSIVIFFVEFSAQGVPFTPVFGALGLIVAIAALWVAVRWLGLPGSSDRQVEGVESDIWTPSLIVVIVIVALLNLWTTYIALGPGV